MIRRLDALAPALSRWFTARLAASAPVEIEGPERIATGNSRAMLSVGVRFERDGEKQRREYVIRAEQGGVFGTESLQEVRFMRAVRAAGLPVAPVRWLETDAAVLGAPFFVMDRIEGRGENPGLASIRHYLRLLRQQHDLDWRRPDFAFVDAPASARAATLAQIDHWYGVYRASAPLPIPLLEEATAWLRLRAPTPERVVLVHGDPGPGNYVFEGDEVRAITDWEFAHPGDPDEDWVYLATVRGGGRPREEWSALFADEAGVSVSDDAWHYWDAFSQFKGACANTTALRVFCEGVNPAPNMAAVGTSIHAMMLSRLASLVAA